MQNPTKMVMSDEDRQWFKDELATVEKNLEKKFQTELAAVQSNLQTELTKITKEVTDLKKTVDEMKTEIADCKHENALLHTENQSLRNDLVAATIQHDDLEQYGRRYAIRVEGIEYHETEDNAQLQETLKTEFGKLGYEIQDSDINRLHRSSKVKNVKKDKKSTETYPTKQCLVKFGNWRARDLFKSFNKDTKGRTNIRVYHDLTARRLTLLNEARKRIQEGFRSMNYSDERINELPNTEKIFAFADINSNLQVRCKGALYSFNDEDRLREILKNHAFPRTLGATANRWGDDSDISRNFGQDFNSVPLSSVADFSSNINPYSTRTLRSSVSANKR